MYGNIVLLLTAAIWGFAFVAQSMGMEYVGPFTFQSVRSILGAVVLIPIIFANRAVKRRNGSYKPMDSAQKKQVVVGGIICGIVLCVASCFQQVGIQYTTVGKSGFLTSMYIVIVPVLGLFLGKKVHKKLILCIILAVIGLYLISMTESFALSRGDALVCICAVCFAVHIMVVDHFAPGVDGVVLSCIQFFVSGIVSGIPMLLFEHPEIKDILDAWLPILYAGVMSCGAGYTLQIIGQQHAEPAVATLLMSLESVFSMVGGIIIMHQIPTARETVGCILLFAAVVIVQLPILNGRKKECVTADKRR